MKSELGALNHICLPAVILFLTVIFKMTDSSTRIVTASLISADTQTESLYAIKSSPKASNKESTAFTYASEKPSLVSLDFRITTKNWTKVENVPAKQTNITPQYIRNKHHHEHHWGPFFEEPLNSTSGALQLTTYVSAETALNCRVGMLQDKTVMWVRRTAEKVSLLTVGNITYSGDPRINVKFQYPNNWRLIINPVKKEDASLYMCQVSTHPPRVFATNLTVLDSPIRVTDEKGFEVSDRFYKAGSTIDLTCQVSKQFFAFFIKDKNKEIYKQKRISRTEPADQQQWTNFLQWHRDGEKLPETTTNTFSSSDVWHKSRVVIPKADFSYAGIYSCSVGTKYEAVVHVQILIGELPAAVQHNSAQPTSSYLPSYAIVLLPCIQTFVHIPQKM